MGHPHIFFFFFIFEVIKVKSMNEEDVILSLVKDLSQKDGNCYEPRLVKLATLLNINAEKVQKIKENLTQKGKLEVKGSNIFLP